MFSYLHKIKNYGVNFRSENTFVKQGNSIHINITDQPTYAHLISLNTPKKSNLISTKSDGTFHSNILYPKQTDTNLLPSASKPTVEVNAETKSLIADAEIL